MAETVRSIQRRFPGKETLEGAGVRLRRAFSNPEVALLDPFLLLDNFGSNNPADYCAGFPWHPHRGIETVTYMLSGEVEHGDTLGNQGTIGAGDLQWMRSGGGIVHQEMPQQTEGELRGFQLWLNMPARSKMDPPAYHDVRAPNIPKVDGDNGQEVKVVAGSCAGVEGPIHHAVTRPEYLDVLLPPGSSFSHPVSSGRTVFATVISGSGTLDGSGGAVRKGETVLFGDGGKVAATPGADGLRFLLVSGTPLHEPIAWYGPIVMNTQREIATALSELRKGDFLKHREVEVEG